MNEDEFSGDAVIVPRGGLPSDLPAEWFAGRHVESFASLDEARGHPEAVLIIKADDSEQRVLVTCPLVNVNAALCDLACLARDLYTIAVYGAFYLAGNDVLGTAALHFVPLPIGTSVRGRGTGGRIEAGMWLDHELEYELRLRESIERVITGRAARLELRNLFPDDAPSSIEDVRPYPLARVSLWSGAASRRVVDASAAIVNIDQAGIETLLADIDARIMARPYYLPRPEIQPSRIHYQRRVREDRPLPDLQLWHDTVQHCRADILQVLAGIRSRL